MPITISFELPFYILAGIGSMSVALYRKRMKEKGVPKFDPVLVREAEFEEYDGGGHEQEDDLNPEQVRAEIRAILLDHCPAEQNKLRETIRDTIRATVAECMEGQAEWRGAVDQRLANGKGHARDVRHDIEELHRKIEDRDDRLRKKIDDLYALVLQKVGGP